MAAIDHASIKGKSFRGKRNYRISRGGKSCRLLRKCTITGREKRRRSKERKEEDERKMKKKSNRKGIYGESWLQ